MALAPRLLAALASASLVVAAIGASDASARRTEVLRVRARTSIWWLDADRLTGASTGDAIFGSDVLIHRPDRPPKAAVLGRSHWRLVYVTSTIAVLTETAYLPQGTITCRGKVRAGARQNDLRVVRGSGAFRGANGVCTTRSAPAGSLGASQKRFELVLP
jgi:hypothetical protein